MARILKALHPQRWISGVLLVVLLLLTLFPLYWMAITAVKPSSELYVRRPTFWPRRPTLLGVRRLFTETSFATQLWNSFYIASCSTALSILLGTSAAYSLSRLRYPGRDLIAGGIILVYLLPVQLLVIPLYFVMDALHLLATPSYALILSYLAFTVPFCVWMLRGYFDTIPVELEEAALIDGASRPKALLLIVLPLAAPGLASAAILTFTLAWNEFLFALVFTAGPKTMTAPVGLHLLASADVFLWDQLMSAAVIMSVPVAALYVFAQRYVVSGLTAGALKG